MIEPRIYVYGDYFDAPDVEVAALSAFRWFRIGDARSPLIGELLERMGARFVIIEIDISLDEVSDTSHMLERRGLTKSGEIRPRAIDDRDEAIRRAWSEGMWDYLRCQVTVSMLGGSIAAESRAEYKAIEWSSVGDLIWGDPRFEIHFAERIVDYVQRPVRRATAAVGQVWSAGSYDDLLEELRAPPLPPVQVEEGLE